MQGIVGQPVGCPFFVLGHFVGETYPVGLNVKHCLIYYCVKFVKTQIINRLNFLKNAHVKLLSSTFA